MRCQRHSQRVREQKDRRRADSRGGRWGGDGGRWSRCRWASGLSLAGCGGAEIDGLGEDPAPMPSGCRGGIYGHRGHGHRARSDRFQRLHDGFDSRPVGSDRR